MLFALLALPPHAIAQWMADGNPLCRAEGGQQPYAIASLDYDFVGSGSGGALIIWADTRDFVTNDYDLYYKSIDRTGHSAGGDGTALVTGPGRQHAPVAARTGPWGGHPPTNSAVIAVWLDSREGFDQMDIYAQRIAGSGEWAANGLAVCTASGIQRAPVVVGDVEGASLVAWIDERAGNADIYAQKLNPDGTPSWTADGIPVCSTPDGVSQLRIDSDAAGGAVLAWTDERLGSKIFAVRLTAEGTVAPGWAANGTLVCDVHFRQSDPVVVADGTGGIVVAFRDDRNGNPTDIYAMRLTGTGAPAPGWPTSGTPVCVGSSRQALAILPSMDGGGFIVWSDHRSSSPPSSRVDVFALRLIGDGSVAQGWATNGNLVGQGADPFSIAAVPRGTDGLIAVWSVLNSDELGGISVRAGALNASGQVPFPWPSEGVQVSSQPGGSLVAVWDGGSMITSWADSRDEAVSGADVYVTSVGGSGGLGVGVGPARDEELRLTAARPNPSYGPVRFSLDLPIAGSVRAAVVDLAGREVAVLWDGELAAGQHPLVWQRAPGTAETPAGVYFLVVRAGSDRLAQRFVSLR